MSVLYHWSHENILKFLKDKYPGLIFEYSKEYSRFYIQKGHDILNVTSPFGMCGWLVVNNLYSLRHGEVDEALKIFAELSGYSYLFGLHSKEESSCLPILLENGWEVIDTWENKRTHNTISSIKFEIKFRVKEDIDILDNSIVFVRETLRCLNKERKSKNEV